MPLWIRICSITFILISLAALFANILMPYDPNANSLLERNLPPVFMGGSMSHIFGTDELGRDIFSRILYGTRVSLGMTMFGIVIGGSVGVLLGLSAGYIGGIWDRIVMALINFQQSVPVTLIIMLGVVVFGRSIPVLMCFIGLAKWEYYAKFTRSTVLGIKDKQFVEAAKSYHASGFRIVFRYIFSECAPIPHRGDRAVISVSPDAGVLPDIYRDRSPAADSDIGTDGRQWKKLPCCHPVAGTCSRGGDRHSLLLRSADRRVDAG